MSILLIGAGGHARMLVEILKNQGQTIAGYVAPETSDWLDAPRLNALPSSGKEHGIVIGMGGVTPTRLRERLALVDDAVKGGFTLPPVVHPSAVVSESAKLEPAAVVLAMAVVQPDAKIGRGAIINTGSIVEHGCVIEAGTHVAPGATVLGDVHVGACSMIGAGAVVLQGTKVPRGTLVKAQSLYPSDVW
jgi:UDP-perosamine 4-acetyltransferase